ncbi:MAG: hypothetical protein AAFR52_19335 [Pseudomonadota bacterium]
MQVADFLEEYALAYSAGDIETMADRFDLPCPIIRPEGATTIAGRSALVDFLQDQRDTYASLGVGRIRGANVEEVGPDDGLGLLNIRWQLYHRHGHLMTACASTYVLRRRDGLIRIAALVAHDELEKRALLMARHRRSDTAG